MYQVILVTSPHCGPCRTFKPIFNEVAEQLTDQAEFSHRDVSKDARVATDLGIRQVPTTVIVKDGHVQHRHVGAMNESQFKHFLAPILG